ncbi:hypothetical protein [Mesorhizobium sp. B2-6-4]|uniref:hypothetical protein n=1 Tax=Mesorhizobium sp. B2-6-4 TaxID=2589913 RepID=UPI00112BC712|nr:hypothetical protein [Mesorhizobium sp. B2-6-4]TPJ52710.1 hypothetical protein FJ426_15770 [Mesorhizobium sp. B2-6-4]
MKSEENRELTEIAFVYPGVLRIALRMLMATQGVAALDSFAVHAEAAVKDLRAQGDDDPYSLARKSLARDIALVRDDPALT